MHGESRLRWLHAHGRRAVILMAAAVRALGIVGVLTAMIVGASSSRAATGAPAIRQKNSLTRPSRGPKGLTGPHGAIGLVGDTGHLGLTGPDGFVTGAYSQLNMATGTATSFRRPTYPFALGGGGLDATSGDAIDAVSSCPATGVVSGTLQLIG
jgi:hypothetical protein